MDRANEIRSREAQEAEAERQKWANEVRDKESKKEIKVLEENRIKAQKSTPPEDSEAIWEVSNDLSKRHQFSARRNFYLVRGQIVVLATNEDIMQTFFQAMKSISLESEMEGDVRKLVRAATNKKDSEDEEEGDKETNNTGDNLQK